MPIGLWHKVIDRFAPARVLEFDASTEGDAVLANVAGKDRGQGSAAAGQRRDSARRLRRRDGPFHRLWG